ncbi:MAG: hypothetical protein IT435_12000 [Phycisphaerales bacterium]|nr:hypothetical protein [Phycisphaerales bacterium]
MAAILALAGTAFGQARGLAPAGTQPTAPAQPAAKPQEEPRFGAIRPELQPVVELADQPVRLDSVALTFFPPTDCTVQTTSVAGVATIEIMPRDSTADSTWLLTIKAPRTGNDKLTAAQIADGALVDLIAANGLVFDAERGLKGPQIKDMWQKNEITSVGNFLGYQGLVQSRHRDVEFPGFPTKAEQFFVSLPSGAKQEPLMRGLTVVKVGPDRFITFELFTTRPFFEQAKDIYTVLLHAAKVGDPAALAEERANAVNAGLALFEKLTAEEMKQLLADLASKTKNGSGERWERRYKPAPSRNPMDATELGYRRMKVWSGKRGELKANPVPARFNNVEMQDGYLVTLDARLVEDNQIIDSRGRFFVTTDRVEEAWTISLSVQGLDHKNRKTYTETGARNGKDMNVNVAGAGNPGVAALPIIETAGYISRVDSYLLPQILIRSKLAGDYGFYVFQSDAGNIRLRRDVLSEPSDRPDMWEIETRIGEDAKPQISMYTREGVLISSVLPDKSVWEPIEQDALVRLWRNKGMPMD